MERAPPAADCADCYPPIDAYAFLSDTRTAALVGPDGAIEWLCVPRFDGPSLFGRLLDREIGGAFELRVRGASTTTRRYLDDTLVLETRYEDSAAAATVWDFFAVVRLLLRPQPHSQVIARGKGHALVHEYHGR